MRLSTTSSIALGAVTAMADGGTGAVRRYGGWGGGSGGYPYSYGDGSGSGSGSGSASDGFGSGSTFSSSLGSAVNYRTIHGILASVAFVVLFPAGSILMRLVPGRFAIWAHAITQILAYLVYVAGAALGIYLVSTVQLPFAGGNLLNVSSINYHPIIGIVVLAVLFFQPILGYIHHARFKKLLRRTFWSHLHLWNGRLGIVLGIVNGGLGLHIARERSSIKTAYTVVAAILGGLWLLLAIFSEIRRLRSSNNSVDASKNAALPRGGANDHLAVAAAIPRSYRSSSHSRHSHRSHSRHSHSTLGSPLIPRSPEMSATTANVGAARRSTPAGEPARERAPKVNRSHSSHSTVSPV